MNWSHVLWWHIFCCPHNLFLQEEFCMKLQSAWLQRLLISGCMAGVSLYGSAAYAAKCTYTIANDWGSGFTASIRITNDGSAPVNGWNLGWSYSDGSRVTSSWNATVTGANPYSASPVNWNSNIAVGSSVEFGVQGTNGSSKAQVPVVSGAVCTGAVASSAAPASSSSAPAASSISSVAISSVRSSSSANAVSSLRSSSVASVA